MTDSKYTQTYVSFPKEMMERAQNAEEYSGASEYIRVMVSAGESNIAALDPRTLDDSTSQHGNGEQNDLDKLIFEALDDNYAELDEILNNGLQQQISDRLLELAQQDDLPVEKNGFEFKIDE
ncbi:hypothetical protein [Halorubrum sp. AJ67]|uniref:hypothetical protein n=1 Tax=Halorubrum sp. AJ67 TaxID=1173487 RepID=UPI00064F5254|nr:hypothetical protein [Halorubrum sp. AJ67]